MGVLSAGVAGFALSMGLILAIGPQNIFVLRQGPVSYTHLTLPTKA